MATRINGNDVTIPGTLFLTGPGVEGFALALGPGGAVVSSGVPVSSLTLLNNVSVVASPNSIVQRSFDGSGFFWNLSVDNSATINGGMVLQGATFEGHFLRVAMYSNADPNVGIRITARAAQTANMMEWQDIGEAVLGRIDGEGRVVAPIRVTPNAGVGRFGISDADGDLEWDESSIRIKAGKLQLKNSDDGLFYDVTLRNVASVPTLSVEGSGEV